MSKKAIGPGSLTDDYIRRLLMQSKIAKALGLRKENITPEMIELKRQGLILLRNLKVAKEQLKKMTKGRG